MSVKWIIVYIMTKFMILFINHYAILSKELKVSQSYQYNTQFALEDAFLEADVLIGWLNPPFKGYIGMSLSNKCKNAMYTTAQSPHTSIFEDILAITSLLSLQSPQTIHHVIFFLFFTGSSILPCYGRLGLSLVLYDCLPLPWDILLLLLLSRFSRVQLYETP